MKHCGLTTLLSIAILQSIWAAAGCSSDYVLRGRVISGSYLDISVVEPGDGSQDGPGIEGVKLSIHRDPDSLGRKLVASGRSRADGTISIPIDQFGAGWMDEQWLIQAQRQGYETTEAIIRLPSKDEQILILMTPGVSIAPKQDDDLIGEYERYR